MNLTLEVIKPLPIKSWRALHTAAMAFRDDYDRHGYHGSRSSRRTYSACVKVHNCFADVTKSIEKLNVADPEIEATLRENFGPNEVESYYNEWISDSQDQLVEWFEGTTHASYAYLIEVLREIENGEISTFHGLSELKGKRAKRVYVKAILAETQLFKEALATVDTDSIAWEGRSSGYVTWNCDRDLGRVALDVEEWAHDAINNNQPARTFSEALEEFRQIERTHNLNLAILDYVEAWAKSMSFQDELDYLVMQNFDEMGGVAGESLPPLEKYADLEVTVVDSIAAGNCMSGTMNWIRDNIPGRASATIKELLAIDDMKASVRRLCRFVVRRHVSTQSA
jgi:hypothetical protein